MRTIGSIVAGSLALAGSGTPALQHDGISVRLECDSAAVRMGAPVLFRVSLVFDSTSANPATRLLNRFSPRYEFEFVDEQTGASFRRPAYDVGMPRHAQPGDMMRLAHGDRLSLEDATVHLLAEDGEQIPPGRYAVRVTYANRGDGTELYRDSTGVFRQRQYTGPWKIWTGTVQSHPLRFTVIPAGEENVKVPVPTALEIDTQRFPGQIAWRPATFDSTFSVVSRPGFARGNRWELSTVTDGDTIWRYPRGYGLDPSGWSSLPPDVSRRTQTATHTEFILFMEVFESSVQGRHMWMPERGDFKVLWRGDVRRTLAR